MKRIYCEYLEEYMGRETKVGTFSTKDGDVDITAHKINRASKNPKELPGIRAFLDDIAAINAEAETDKPRIPHYRKDADYAAPSAR